MGRWAPSTAGHAPRRSTRNTVRVSELGEQNPGIWRPLTVRGVPLHFVVPAVIGAIGLAMLITGGFVAVLGAWILTIGFSLSVGAFVADQRALGVPAAVWLSWLLVSAIAGEGSGLPRTPILLAIVLAGLGAVCVWLGQRAVQPAVEGARIAGRERGIDTDIDALLAPVHAPEDSPSLDPAAEVDEALATLLLEEDLADELAAHDAGPADAGEDSDDHDANADDHAADGHAGDDSEDAQAGDDTGADDAETEAAETDAAAEPDPSTDGDDAPNADGNPQSQAEDEPADELDEGGHVIEFAALSEADLVDDDAPLPAATEAGRRDDT